MPAIFKQITDLIGLVVLVQVLPILTGALGGLQGVFGVAPQAGGVIQAGAAPPPRAITPPLDVEEEIAKRRAAATAAGSTAFDLPDVYSDTPQDALSEPGVHPLIADTSRTAPTIIPLLNIAPELFEGINIPARQQAQPVELGPEGSTSVDPWAWEAGRVVGQGVTGGIAFERIATGIGRETRTVYN